jgi:hypothetical protein
VATPLPPLKLGETGKVAPRNAPSAAGAIVHGSAARKARRVSPPGLALPHSPKIRRGAPADGRMGLSTGRAAQRGWRGDANRGHDCSKEGLTFGEPLGRPLRLRFSIPDGLTQWRV